MQVATTIDGDNGMVVKRLSVPLGLEELMESLTKQVLLKQPKDIYSFASHHFTQLLQVRDKAETGGDKKSVNGKVKVRSATVATKFNKLPTPIIFTNSKTSAKPKTPKAFSSVPIKSRFETSPRTEKVKSSSSEASQTNSAKQGRSSRSRWMKQDTPVKKPPLPKDIEKKSSEVSKKTIRENYKSRKPLNKPKEDVVKETARKRSLSKEKNNKIKPRVITTPSSDDNISINGSQVGLNNKINKKKVAGAAAAAVATVTTAGVAKKQIDTKLNKSKLIKDEAVDSDFVDGDDKESVVIENLNYVNQENIHENDDVPQNTENRNDSGIDKIIESKAGETEIVKADKPEETEKPKEDNNLGIANEKETEQLKNENKPKENVNESEPVRLIESSQKDDEDVIKQSNKENQKLQQDITEDKNDKSDNEVNKVDENKEQSEDSNIKQLEEDEVKSNEEDSKSKIKESNVSERKDNVNEELKISEISDNLKKEESNVNQEDKEKIEALNQEQTEEVKVKENLKTEDELIEDSKATENSDQNLKSDNSKKDETMQDDNEKIALLNQESTADTKVNDIETKDNEVREDSEKKEAAFEDLKTNDLSDNSKTEELSNQVETKESEMKQIDKEDIESKEESGKTEEVESITNVSNSTEDKGNQLQNEVLKVNDESKDRTSSSNELSKKDIEENVNENESEKESNKIHKDSLILNEEPTNLKTEEENASFDTLISKDRKESGEESNNLPSETNDLNKDNLTTDNNLESTSNESSFDKEPINDKDNTAPITIVISSDDDDDDRDSCKSNLQKGDEKLHPVDLVSSNTEKVDTYIDKSETIKQSEESGDHSKDDSIKKTLLGDANENSKLDEDEKIKNVLLSQDNLASENQKDIEQTKTPIDDAGPLHLEDVSKYLSNRSENIDSDEINDVQSKMDKEQLDSDVSVKDSHVELKDKSDKEDMNNSDIIKGNDEKLMTEKKESENSEENQNKTEENDIDSNEMKDIQSEKDNTQEKLDSNKSVTDSQRKDKSDVEVMEGADSIKENKKILTTKPEENQSKDIQNNDRDEKDIPTVVSKVKDMKNDSDVKEKEVSLEEETPSAVSEAVKGVSNDTESKLEKSSFDALALTRSFMSHETANYVSHANYNSKGKVSSDLSKDSKKVTDENVDSLKAIDLNSSNVNEKESEKDLISAEALTNEDKPESKPSNSDLPKKRPKKFKEDTETKSTYIPLRDYSEDNTEDQVDSITSAEESVKSDMFGHSIQPNVPKTEEISAATKIQSAWRGHTTRKSLQPSMTLKSIQEPADCDELPHQRGLTNTVSLNPLSEENQLTDEHVAKAMQQLDTLEVPSDEPKVRGKRSIADDGSDSSKKSIMDNISDKMSGIKNFFQSDKDHPEKDPKNESIEKETLIGESGSLDDDTLSKEPSDTNVELDSSIAEHDVPLPKDSSLNGTINDKSITEEGQDLEKEIETETKDSLDNITETDSEKSAEPLTYNILGNDKDFSDKLLESDNSKQENVSKIPNEAESETKIEDLSKENETLNSSDTSNKVNVESADSQIDSKSVDKPEASDNAHENKPGNVENVAENSSNKDDLDNKPEIMKSEEHINDLKSNTETDRKNENSTSDNVTAVSQDKTNDIIDKSNTVQQKGSSEDEAEQNVMQPKQDLTDKEKSDAVTIDNNTNECATNTDNTINENIKSRSDNDLNTHKSENDTIIHENESSESSRVNTENNIDENIKGKLGNDLKKEKSENDAVTIDNNTTITDNTINESIKNKSDNDVEGEMSDNSEANTKNKPEDIIDKLDEVDLLKTNDAKNNEAVETNVNLNVMKDSGNKSENLLNDTSADITTQQAESLGTLETENKFVESENDKSVNMSISNVSESKMEDSPEDLTSKTPAKDGKYDTSKNVDVKLDTNNQDHEKLSDEGEEGFENMLAGNSNNEEQRSVDVTTDKSDIMSGSNSEEKASDNVKSSEINTADEVRNVKSENVNHKEVNETNSINEEIRNDNMNDINEKPSENTTEVSTKNEMENVKLDENDASGIHEDTNTTNNLNEEVQSKQKDKSSVVSDTDDKSKPIDITNIAELDTKLDVPENTSEQNSDDKSSNKSTESKTIDEVENNNNSIDESPVVSPLETDNKSNVSSKDKNDIIESDSKTDEDIVKSKSEDVVTENIDASENIENKSKDLSSDELKMENTKNDDSSVGALKESENKSKGDTDRIELNNEPNVEVTETKSDEGFNDKTDIVNHENIKNNDLATDMKNTLKEAEIKSETLSSEQKDNAELSLEETVKSSESKPEVVSNQELNTDSQENVENNTIDNADDSKTETSTSDKPDDNETENNDVKSMSNTNLSDEKTENDTINQESDKSEDKSSDGINVKAKEDNIESTVLTSDEVEKNETKNSTVVKDDELRSKNDTLQESISVVPSRSETENEKISQESEETVSENKAEDTLNDVTYVNGEEQNIKAANEVDSEMKEYPTDDELKSLNSELNENVPKVETPDKSENDKIHEESDEKVSEEKSDDSSSGKTNENLSEAQIVDNINNDKINQETEEINSEKKPENETNKTENHSDTISDSTNKTNEHVSEDQSVNKVEIDESNKESDELDFEKKSEIESNKTEIPSDMINDDIKSDTANTNISGDKSEDQVSATKSDNSQSDKSNVNPQEQENVESNIFKTDAIETNKTEEPSDIMNNELQSVNDTTNENIAEDKNEKSKDAPSEKKFDDSLSEKSNVNTQEQNIESKTDELENNITDNDKVNYKSEDESSEKKSDDSSIVKSNDNAQEHNMKSNDLTTDEVETKREEQSSNNNISNDNILKVSSDKEMENVKKNQDSEENVYNKSNDLTANEVESSGISSNKSTVLLNEKADEDNINLKSDEEVDRTKSEDVPSDNSKSAASMENKTEDFAVDEVKNNEQDKLTGDKSEDVSQLETEKKPEQNESSIDAQDKIESNSNDKQETKETKSIDEPEIISTNSIAQEIVENKLNDSKSNTVENNETEEVFKDESVDPKKEDTENKSDDSSSILANVNVEDNSKSKSSDSAIDEVENNQTVSTEKPIDLTKNTLEEQKTDNDDNLDKNQKDPDDDNTSDMLTNEEVTDKKSQVPDIKSEDKSNIVTEESNDNKLNDSATDENNIKVKTSSSVGDATNENISELPSHYEMENDKVDQESEVKSVHISPLEADISSKVLTDNDELNLNTKEEMNENNVLSDKSNIESDENNETKDKNDKMNDNICNVMVLENEQKSIDNKDINIQSNDEHAHNKEVENMKVESLTNSEENDKSSNEAEIKSEDGKSKNLEVVEDNNNLVKDDTFITQEQNSSNMTTDKVENGQKENKLEDVIDNNSKIEQKNDVINDPAHKFDETNVSDINHLDNEHKTEVVPDASTNVEKHDIDKGNSQVTSGDTESDYITNEKSNITDLVSNENNSDKGTNDQSDPIKKSDNENVINNAEIHNNIEENTKNEETDGIVTKMKVNDENKAKDGKQHLLQGDPNTSQDDVITQHLSDCKQDEATINKQEENIDNNQDVSSNIEKVSSSDNKSDNLNVSKQDIPMSDEGDVNNINQTEIHEDDLKKEKKLVDLKSDKDSKVDDQINKDVNSKHITTDENNDVLKTENKDMLKNDPFIEESEKVDDKVEDLISKNLIESGVNDQSEVLLRNEDNLQRNEEVHERKERSLSNDNIHIQQTENSSENKDSEVENIKKVEDTKHTLESIDSFPQERENKSSKDDEDPENLKEKDSQAGLGTEIDDNRKADSNVKEIDETEGNTEIFSKTDEENHSASLKDGQSKTNLDEDNKCEETNKFCGTEKLNNSKQMENSDAKRIDEINNNEANIGEKKNESKSNVILKRDESEVDEETFVKKSVSKLGEDEDEIINQIKNDLADMKNLIENGTMDEEHKEPDNAIYENAPTRPVTSDVSPTENVQVGKENDVKNFVKIPENHVVGSEKNVAEAATKIQSAFRGYKARKTKDGSVGEIIDNNNKEDHKNKNEVINDVIAKIEAKQTEELEKIASPKIQSKNKSVDEYINSLIEEKPKVKPSLGQFFQNLAQPTINKINNKQLDESHLVKANSDETEKSSIEDVGNLNNVIEKKAEPFYLHEPSEKKLDTPIAAAFRASPQVGNYSPTNIQVVVQDQRGNSPTSVQSIQSPDGLTLQANDAPGAKAVTSDIVVSSDGGGADVAQASDKAASAPSAADNEAAGSEAAAAAGSDCGSVQRGSLPEMDGKRNNATITEKNMESAAATKIQASFRGYQVRKQLKTKSGDIKNTKRSPRRKSSGKLIESGKMMKRDTSELEERSATKIQAGIRGFLVRRRHQKNSKKHD